MAYTGLPPKLKQEVFARDGWRCRWCGTTNRGPFDAHHIEYRRGYSYDRLDNLITLCRTHHDLVHDSFQIPKTTAQKVLAYLIAPVGLSLTGIAVLRRMQRAEGQNERASDSRTVVSDAVSRETGPLSRRITGVIQGCLCTHAAGRHHRGRCLAPGCDCPTASPLSHTPGVLPGSELQASPGAGAPFRSAAGRDSAASDLCRGASASEPGEATCTHGSPADMPVSTAEALDRSDLPMASTGTSYRTT